MRALREANQSRGIDILTQNEYNTLTTYGNTTLYVIGTVASNEVTVARVYVGTVEQDVLINNAGGIVWMKDDFIVADKHAAGDDILTSFTNLPVPLSELV